MLVHVSQLRDVVCYRSNGCKRCLGVMLIKRAVTACLIMEKEDIFEKVYTVRGRIFAGSGFH